VLLALLGVAVYVYGNLTVYLALLEDLVVPNPATSDTGVVDPAIVSAASIARATVQTSIETTAPENGEQLKQVVQERKQGWMGFDREFGVELALLQSVFGDGAKTRLKQKLLDAMWSQASPKKPSESLQILEKALHTAEYKLASESYQGKFKTMVTILGRIVDGRPPCCETSAKDDMLKDVVVKLPFFVEHQQAASASGEAETVWGAAALILKYDEVKTKCDAGTASMDDVTPFHVFGYLAKPEDQPRYAAMVDAVREKLGTLGARRRPTKRSTPASGSSALSGSDDSAISAALAMFA
jgi:hypothetical protein